MAKVNFSRVEAIIEKGMHKMKRDQLLKLADEATGKKKKKSEIDTSNPYQIMIIIEQDLTWLKKKDPKIYSKHKIKKTHIQKLLTTTKDKSKKIPKETLKEMNEIREKITNFQKKHYPKKSDEELIEAEKKRYINKRQNVNEKWLPFK